MELVDYIAIAAIVLIIGAAIFYIIRAKMRGDGCVGCPHSKQCGGKCSCGGGSVKKSEDNESK